MSAKMEVKLHSFDWNTKLAMGNGKFRRKAAYNTFATGRQLRRIKERELARLIKKSGVAK